MKAWIINAHALPPSQGGGTRHYSLVKAMNAAGDDAVIIASDAHYAYGTKLASKAGREVLDGVPFHWVPAPVYKGAGVKRIWNHLVFSQRVTRLGPGLERPDVIVGSSPHFFAAWAAERLARRLRVPFVLEIRDFWPESLVDFAGVPESHPMVRWMRKIEPRLYGNAAQIVSLLSRAPEYLSRFGAAEKCVWVPNGIDLSLAPVPSAPPGEKPMHLMYSGAHGVANGLSTLVQAMRLLDPSEVMLSLVGDGPLKPQLVAEAESLRHVRFLDSVPKTQIFDLLQTADAFTTLAVNAKVFKWGISPNKVFDYLAMARPVVFAGRVPDSPVELAQAGVLTDVTPESLAEGILKVAALTANDRAAYGASGRRYVEENHDMAKLAMKFREALVTASRG